MQEEINVLCLGREMELGNLYDCRKEQLISGNLWNSTKIDEHKKIPKHHHEPTSDFTFVTEDMSTMNTTAIDLHGNLKLSFLSGLIDVNGAAKYLYNSRNSFNQARVVLKYSCRCGTEKLIDIEKMIIDMNDSAIEKRLATHVVIELEYGADAFFVFTREARNLDDRHDLEYSLKCAIGEKVPLSKNGGTIDIDSTVSKTANEDVTKFMCAFHGDISLPTITLTYGDALDVCKNLPQMIADKLKRSASDGVLYGLPKVARLYPLRRLDPRAAVVAHMISTVAVREAESFLDDFRSRLVEANALELAKICQKFPALLEMIKKFKNFVQRFLEEFQKHLALILPEIRDGKTTETSLLEFISHAKTSPFNALLLEKWITYRKRELSALETYVSVFEERKIEIASRAGDLEKYIHNKEFRHVLVFSFERLNALDSAADLELLNRFETFSMSDHDFTSTKNSDVVELFNSWCDDENITSHLRKQMDVFCDFVHANNDSKDLKCISATISSVGSSNEKAGTVYLFSDGKKRVFHVPSLPTSVRFGICDNCIYRYNIRWKPPVIGAESVTCYRVYYRRAPRSVSRPVLMWLLTAGEKIADPTMNAFLSSDTFTAFHDDWWYRTTSGGADVTEMEFYSQLSTSYEYQFKVAAVTEAGQTGATDVVIFYHG